MNKHQNFSWAVVGAGPAGIATIGKLIDFGVDPHTIVWIDPAFKGGAFGTKWRHVPSNTLVALFRKFFLACQAFHFDQCPPEFAFHQLPPEKTCPLFVVAEPLQWVTEQLKPQVVCVTGWVEELKLCQHNWQIHLNENTYCFKNVVLAIGAEPKMLSYPVLTTLCLETALNPGQLASACESDDTIAVFGSSHSAILILRNLLEHTSVKKVINFYRDPLRYAVNLGDEILFDDTGLKGTTAQWARENLEGDLPKRLNRLLVSSPDFQKYLHECTKVIYAVGFERCYLKVEGLDSLTYNDKTGIIAPGLFGIGIAFPEAKENHLGIVEYRVGLWKFMDYLNKIVPVWLKYSL